LNKINIYIHSRRKILIEKVINTSPTMLQRRTEHIMTMYDTEGKKELEKFEVLFYIHDSCTEMHEKHKHSLKYNIKIVNNIGLGNGKYLTEWINENFDLNKTYIYNKKRVVNISRKHHLKPTLPLIDSIDLFGCLPVGYTITRFREKAQFEFIIFADSFKNVTSAN